jgi:6,7-dimethyl-8-ribityllumazine synthase
MTAVDPLYTDGASPTGRVAVIQAYWRKGPVAQALAGFTAELGRLGFRESLVDRWDLPDAFEASV